jgi:hypothetical protein
MEMNVTDFEQRYLEYAVYIPVTSNSKENMSLKLLNTMAMAAHSVK